MLVEDWVELIKNVLSPSAFKEVATAALRALYGKPVVLADGTGDDGVDAWLELPSGRVPVQFYAGRAEAWDAKLTRDLETHDLLKKSGRLFFVCAQTPTALAQQHKVAQLETTYGVTITLIDARGIASTTHEPDVLAALSRSVPVLPVERAPRAWDPAVDVRLAFTFFHQQSGDLRAEVARSVLSACLVGANEPIPTETLLDQAITAAGIGRARGHGPHRLGAPAAREGVQGSMAQAREPRGAPARGGLATVQGHSLLRTVRSA